MDQTPRLLIYCEGETEKAYLQALVDSLKLADKAAVRKTSACDPLSLLSAAYKEFAWAQATEDRPFTEIWVVFDRDHHHTYREVFEVVKKLPPVAHLCWTNPCIEFWFWLHYCGDASQLTFDDVQEIASEKAVVDLGDGLTEETVVRRLQRSILPETMLALLKKRRPDYVKAKCLPDLISRSQQACENLARVAPSTDPQRLGSAMPALLKRLVAASGAKGTLSALADEALAEVTVAAGTAPAPEPPQDMMKPADECRALLKRSLEDWAHVEVYRDQIVLPPEVLDRAEMLFEAVKMCRTDKLSVHQMESHLHVIANLRKNLKQAQRKDVKKQMRGRINAIGTIYEWLARRFECEAMIEGVELKKVVKVVKEAPTTLAPSLESPVQEASAPVQQSEPEEDAAVEPDVEANKEAELCAADIPDEVETSLLEAALPGVESGCDFELEPDAMELPGLDCCLRDMDRCRRAFDDVMAALQGKVQTPCTASDLLRQAIAIQEEALTVLSLVTQNVGMLSVGSAAYESELPIFEEDY